MECNTIFIISINFMKRYTNAITKEPSMVTAERNEVYQKNTQKRSHKRKKKKFEKVNKL